MKYDELIVRFCGIAGDGIVSAGRILAGACSEIGLHVMVNDIYSAEIRGGGKATTTVRFSSKKVRSLGDGIDMLIGLQDKEAIEEIDEVNDSGSIIYDSSTPFDIKEGESLAAHIPPDKQGFGIPIKRLANMATGSNKGRNVVVIGALAYLYSLPKDIFINYITKIFSRKGEKVLNSNIDAFNLCYSHCEENFPVHDDLNIALELKPHILTTGNDSLSKGSMDCGIKFFAGYPITPATKIMEILAKELPMLGGTVIQSEDEISAISSVVGAGFAGVRAMTATSGPGISLMSEMINCAVISEIPAVIVDVQRGGPSTGLPTKVEQGDLNIALYGGSGDSPRIVMAPSDCEECYSGIQLAFDLAEKYQSPVIFLSDLFLGQRVETVNIGERIEHNRSTRIKPQPEELEDYKRYKNTDSGISPVLVPGETGAVYTITGLEHSEYGTPNFEASVHRMMNKKRFRKFETMKNDIPPADIIGDEDAEIGIATWGSSIGAVLDGMEIARKQGVKSKLIKSIMINPQHEDSFRKFFSSCKRIIVPEMNYQGQYAALLKSRYNIKPIEIHIPAVNPVSPKKIAQKIMEANNELS